MILSGATNTKRPEIIPDVKYLRYLRFDFPFGRRPLVLRELEGSADGGCNLLEFSGCEFELGIAEEHVFLTLHGNEVDMGMGYLKTQHSLTYLDAVEYFLLGCGNLLGKELQVTEFLICQVKQVVNLTLGYAEHVALYERIDIKECKAVLSLSYLVAGNLTLDYS